jgi:hypothetical protein
MMFWREDLQFNMGPELWWGPGIPHIHKKNSTFDVLSFEPETFGIEV